MVDDAETTIETTITGTMCTTCSDVVCTFTEPAKATTVDICVPYTVLIPSGNVKVPKGTATYGDWVNAKGCRPTTAPDQRLPGWSKCN